MTQMKVSKGGCCDAGVLKHLSWLVLFVCLDVHAERREQMVETKQLLGDLGTDMRGNRGMSSSSTKHLSAKHCTLESIQSNKTALFFSLSLRYFFHSSALKRRPKECRVQWVELRVGRFSHFLLE